MQPIPASAVAVYREPPAELLIFSRSISDDDLCAWCSHLWYSPGAGSVCQRHDEGLWPAESDAVGDIRRCTDFAVSMDNDAP